MVILLNSIEPLLGFITTKTGNLKVELFAFFSVNHFLFFLLICCKKSLKPLHISKSFTENFPYLKFWFQILVLLHILWHWIKSRSHKWFNTNVGHFSSKYQDYSPQNSKFRNIWHRFRHPLFYWNTFRLSRFLIIFWLTNTTQIFAGTEIHMEEVFLFMFLRLLKQPAVLTLNLL